MTEPAIGATATLTEELRSALHAAVGAASVAEGADISADDTHDEALTAEPVVPLAVVRPASTAEVAAVLVASDRARVPVTARGSGTGLSGACRPRPDGIVVAFDRMRSILEIDVDNQMAVVQPGVTLRELDEALAPLHLVYPVFPGENSASLGGNVNTNAGGMRAVKYGVTRHHVLGLEAVLPSGEVIRTGGKVVKHTSGYDLTQLIVGSEGTLALVTEITLKLTPRLPHAATVLVPFATLDEVTAAVPHLVRSGVGPLVLEYIDILTMAAVTSFASLDLGIPDAVKDTALAYLVVVLEHRDSERLDEDVALVAELTAAQGALDVYVLPSAAGAALIDAREKAFWVAKANNANDIIDVVVPRASIPDFMTAVSDIAAASGSWITGCGHAGDGNVHLSIFQADPAVRKAALRQVFEQGIALGGAISGEHGIGTEKQALFLELSDPAAIALMRRIKTAFDPNGILNPGTLLGEPVTTPPQEIR